MGGARSVEYEIEQAVGGANFQMTATTSSNMVNLSGLDKGKKYTYRIRSKNSMHHSDFSDAVQIDYILKPSAPMNLKEDEAQRVFSSNSLSTILKWTKSVDNGGDKDTTYSLYRIFFDRQNKGTRKGEMLLFKGLTMPEATVDNLVAGVEYTFEVQAENKFGASDRATSN